LTSQGIDTPPIWAGANVSVTPITADETFVSDKQFNTRKVDATAGNIIVTVTPAFEGQIFNFKRIDNTANTITIVITGATIDDAADTTLTSQYDNKQIQLLSLTEAIII
jgi:hypothetical protein